MFYRETDVVLDYLPGNNRNNPPAVFNGQFDIVRYSGCWYKVSSMNA